MSDFQVGQIVVYYPTYNRLQYLCRVTKVTKNKVEVETYDKEDDPITCKFNSDGWEKNSKKSRWEHLSRIEPLPPKETPDSFIKKIKDWVAAQDKEREERERIRQEEIRTWWNSKGQFIWYDRIALPVEFMGCPVSILKYEDGFQSRMPIVIVRATDEGVEIISAGLCGSHREDGKEDFISAYSSSKVEGKTLEEALFKLAK